jgi:sulfatase maturation enzyme AslB (radical SAM superfamily)
MSDQPTAVKVYFEVTNFCNFRCDFCPMAESTRQPQHMDWRLFTDGIDGIVRDRVTNTVGFHVLGEPMLYPRIYDALSYAKEKGLRTEMHTNGSLLTEETVTRLMQTGLDSLSISVQMLDMHGHECRGTAISFTQYYSRVMEAVQLVRDSHQETEAVLCVMDSSTIRLFDVDKMIRTNRRGQPFRDRLVAFLLDLHTELDRPADRQRIQSVVGWWVLPRPRLLRIDDHVQVYVHPFWDWGNAFTTRRIHPARFGFCGYALSNLGVLSDGTVTICCGDYDGHTSLGNLQTESLASLLSSEPAQAIGDGFRRARVVHSHCQRCLGSASRAKLVLKGGLSLFLFWMLRFQPARVTAVPLVPA